MREIKGGQEEAPAAKAQKTEAFTAETLNADFDDDDEDMMEEDKPKAEKADGGGEWVSSDVLFEAAA
jgi:hypothetical protein